MDQANTKEIRQRAVFNRLLSYLKCDQKRLIAAFLLLIIATGTDLLGPILIKIFIDDHLTPRHFDHTVILLLALGYISIIILSCILNYIQLVLFQTAAMNIIQRMRIDVFTKVHSLGLRFFDRTPVGSLVSKMTNDTEAIKDFYVSVLSAFVQNIVYLAGIFIAMFYLNVKLGLFCLVLLPVIAFIMVLYRKFSSQSFLHMREKLSELNAKLNESLQGMSIVQVFNQQKRLKKEFADVNREHNEAWMKNIKYNGLLLRPAVDLVYVLAIMIVLSFFGIKSFSSPVEIGVIYAFVNYMDRFFEPVNMLMMRLSIFQQAIIAGGRMFELLDENDEAPGAEGGRHPVITEGAIEFKNVTFSYDGKHPVLKNISFHARPGETVALVGHTGSGKSSITNLLMRFYELGQGEITIDSVPLSFYDNHELRNKMGLVLQDSFLFAGTISHNISLFNTNITRERVKEAAAFVQASEFIEKLPEGYDQEIGERGSTFSTGQRQLITFARTMAFEPKILILDEATANIDTQTEDAIQHALQKMRAGRTTIAIAHRLSTIHDADQILVLHKGEIVERGTHQQLIQMKGLYYKMYALQQKDKLSEEVG
ncbi:ABC transporter transmembrane domain-containing protein [Fictibacillus enclensis]|uniref:ABC transporter ATP-binding protein n=1 Tax=Fictibacillus enclensis TaxID=1017270 RepID=UPI0025A30CC2|nr:ABC transporter transmembrane domain-containing protein [Fictibacillus enclensis]MDM5338225.1 ABC transporter transmembrane domain-containing protein [Fictibacillus enclensis]